jgi:hypothetical protein
MMGISILHIHKSLNLARGKKSILISACLKFKIFLDQLQKGMYCVCLVLDHVTCVRSSDTIHACKPLLKLRGELVREPFPVLVTHLVLKTMENLKQTPTTAANGNIMSAKPQKITSNQ